VVEEVRVPRDDLLARDAELPVLCVVKGAVDGAAGYGTAGIEDAVVLLDRRTIGQNGIGAFLQDFRQTAISTEPC
jgi:hypothetical protein